MEDNLLRMFQNQGFQKNKSPNKSDKEVSSYGGRKGIFSKLLNISKALCALTLAAAIICTGAGCAGTKHSFWRAAQRGDIKKVEALLQEGVDANTMYEKSMGEYRFGWTMLSTASGRGHVDVAKLLFDNGVDVNVKNMGGEYRINGCVQRWTC